MARQKLVWFGSRLQCMRICLQALRNATFKGVGVIVRRLRRRVARLARAGHGVVSTYGNESCRRDSEGGATKVGDRRRALGDIDAWRPWQ